MSELFDQLTSELDEISGDTKVYDLAHVRAMAHRVDDLGFGYLAVNIVDGLHVSFVVFRFHCGPATKNGVEVAGEKVQMVFRGSGPSGSLRELRHTHWGEDGYIFYPDAKLIAAAFDRLAEWFDCDG